MFYPRQHRLFCLSITAVVGTGVIVVTPVAARLPAVSVADVLLTAGDEEQITLDLVRHANVTGPQHTVGSYLPGYPLSETGQEQAQTLADQLAPQGPYAGIYAGENIRMPETVQPLADQLGMDVQILPGLNEIPGGIYNYDPIASPGGILYLGTLAAWILGLESVPMPGSSDINGVAFEESFSNAVQTIYDNTVSGDGPTIDVAASGAAAISAWALMNVDNPDLSTLIPLVLGQVSAGKDFLPETGTVVLRGDPDDGWTLVSFNGQPFPQDPGLLTELFVDVRDLITAPQRAAYDIFEAVLGGDPATIEDAFQTGLQNVGAAVVQFPESVINDLIEAVSNLGT
jgi:hypothetical protein